MASSQTWSTPVALHLEVDGARHDVARRKLGRGRRAAA
jgi:hypothetical protein